jgi:preprotein translocase subunit SecF
MTRIFANAKYDFISARRRAILATAVLFGLGLVALLARGGPDYSIEFTGGTLIEVRTTSGEPFNQEAVRTGLSSAGIANAEITPFGQGEAITIRARTAVAGSDAENTQETAAAVGAVLDQVQGVGQWEQSSAEAVSPKIGGELRTKAFLAVFLSFFAVLAYLAYRFEWRFGLAAVIATAHDIVLTVCFVAILDLEVSLVVVAAMLSMVGYSLNDTIIIFDRVRENLVGARREQLIPVLNRSINETLPRSVLTHSTTLAALIALIVFGGPVIRPFALVMAFGVFTGTFSSIFIAAPVLLMIEQRWPGVNQPAAKSAGTRPARSAVSSA